MSWICLMVGLGKRATYPAQLMLTCPVPQQGGSTGSVRNPGCSLPHGLQQPPSAQACWGSVYRSVSLIFCVLLLPREVVGVGGGSFMLAITKWNLISWVAFQRSQIWLEGMGPPGAPGIHAVCKPYQLYPHIPASSRRHCLFCCSICARWTEVTTGNIHWGARLEGELQSGLELMCLKQWFQWWL